MTDKEQLRKEFEEWYEHSDVIIELHTTPRNVDATLDRKKAQEHILAFFWSKLEAKEMRPKALIKKNTGFDFKRGNPTMTHKIYTDDGQEVRMVPVKELPNTFHYHFGGKFDAKMYRAALEAAKQKYSVRVENGVFNKEEWEIGISTSPNSVIYFLVNVDVGTLYDLPEGYRVLIDVNTKEMDLVATILPVEKQSEDELWERARLDYESSIDQMTATAGHHIDFMLWLKSKYHITKIS